VSEANHPGKSSWTPAFAGVTTIQGFLKLHSVFFGGFRGHHMRNHPAGGDNRMFPAGGTCKVADPEPLQPDRPLWPLPNSLMARQHSTSSAWTRPRLSIPVRENLCVYMAGEPLLNAVDVQQGFRGRCRDVSRFPVWHVTAGRPIPPSRLPFCAGLAACGGQRLQCTRRCPAADIRHADPSACLQAVFLFLAWLRSLTHEYRRASRNCKPGERRRSGSRRASVTLLVRKNTYLQALYSVPRAGL